MLDSAPSPVSDPRGTRRDIVPRVPSLPPDDDPLFPALRLKPVRGETGLENMLRQIAALTQSPVPPLLLPERPARERPPLRRAPHTRPAMARSARPARPRRGWAEFARTAASLAAAVILACGTLYPSNGRLALAWVMPGFDDPSGAVTQGSGGTEAATTAALRRVDPPVSSTRIAVIPIPPLPSSKPAAEAAVPAATPPASDPAPSLAAAPSALPDAEPGAPIALLLTRGNELLAAGDVVSARQFFGRAAESGAPAAASAMGKTYDPIYLSRIGAVGVKPDLARAAEWYRQAAKAGDNGAAGRLEHIENDLRVGSAIGPRPTPFQ